MLDTNAIKEFCKNYEICDAHAHIFPEKISQKAVSSIGDFYNLPMTYKNGVSDELIESGNKVGITHYLVCSTATVPHQVESINNFIMNECKLHPEFIGFGTLHPDYDNIENEVDRIIKSGLRGIKIHPDFQEFYIDEDKAFKIYEAAQGKLPILIHMGDPRYDYSRPKRLENIMKAFPKLDVFAAHLGGYERWDEAVTCLFGRNIHFDSSSSLEFMSPEYARDIIRGFGADKIFFGTDFPMWDHLGEVQRFMNLNLNDSENRKILSGNFKKYFEL